MSLKLPVGNRKKTKQSFSKCPTVRQSQKKSAKQQSLHLCSWRVEQDSRPGYSQIDRN